MRIKAVLIVLALSRWWSLRLRRRTSNQVFTGSRPPSETVNAAVGAPLPVTLLVGPLKASHLYREDRLVFATDSEEMGTYQVHRWAQPPTEMVQDLLWRSQGVTPIQRCLNVVQQLSRGLLAARESI